MDANYIYTYYCYTKFELVNIPEVIKDKKRQSLSTLFIASISSMAVLMLFSFQIPSIVNAQLPFNPSSNTGNTTTTNNQSSTSLQQQQFSTYADPQGRFSIDYPSNWTVKPAANRFSSSLVEFVSPTTGVNFVDVDIRVIKNTPFGVETAFNIVLPSLRTTIPNFELNEGPNCDKYTTADGNQACYTIYTRTVSYLSSIKFAVETVGVKVGSDVYLINYTTFPDVFDKNLPIVDQMITSFRGTG